MNNNGIIVLLGYFLICLSFCFEFSGSCSSISTIYMTIIALLQIWEKSIKILFLLPALGSSLVLEFQALSSSLLLLEVLDPRNQKQQTQHLTTILSFSELWDPNLPCYPTSNTYMYHCGTLEELDVTDTEIDDQGFISNLTFTLRCAYLQCMTFASWFM